MQIKPNGNDINLKFTLSDSLNIFGYDTIVNKNILEESINSINPFIDNEVVVFKPSQNMLDSVYVNIFTYDESISTYVNTITPFGFNLDDYVLNSEKYLNSFFIFEYYNNYDVYDKIKITTQYTQKITLGLFGSIPITRGVINLNSFLSEWYFPKSYINNISGDTIIGYVKLSAYNGNNGSIKQYVSDDYYDSITKSFSISSPIRIFKRMEINIPNKTWEFIDYNENNDVIFYEMLNNPLYNIKINNTINKVNNERQTPPKDGKKYFTNDGDYVETP